MLKTIDNGTTLNTALATEVAHFSDGLPRTNPRHVFEVLYRQGQTWFLRRRRDGEEDLIPITPKQASSWLAQKNFIGELGYNFGERVQRRPVSVW